MTEPQTVLSDSPATTPPALRRETRIILANSAGICVLVVTLTVSAQRPPVAARVPAWPQAAPGPLPHDAPAKRGCPARPASSSRCCRRSCSAPETRSACQSSGNSRWIFIGCRRERPQSQAELFRGQGEQTHPFFFCYSVSNSLFGSPLWRMIERSVPPRSSA
jgi:hypothetical protein